MSCITSHIRRHAAAIGIGRQAVETSIEAAATPVIGIGAHAASFSLQRSEPAISIAPSCRTSTGEILIVSPDVVWLTEDNGYEGVFEVIANVEWQVYKEE